MSREDYEKALDRILAVANSQVSKKLGPTAHAGARRVRDAVKAEIGKLRAEQ